MREALAVARQGALIARPGPSYRHHGSSPALTVFIHGYFAGGGVFEPLSDWLADKAVAMRQLHFAYGPYGSVHKLAHRLARNVAEVHPEGPVNLIGHSLGGVIARYYVQMLGGRADRLVCLATPHAGTTRARPWSAVPLAREIAPGSETLRALDATRERLSHVRVCSIVAEDDGMVLPIESAVLAGHEVVRLRGVGHQSVLFHPDAWEHVRRVLRERTR